MIDILWRGKGLSSPRWERDFWPSKALTWKKVKFYIFGAVVEGGSSATLVSQKAHPRPRAKAAASACPRVKSLEAHLVLGPHTWVRTLPTGRLSLRPTLSCSL